MFQFNPYLTNGLSNSYNLDESTFIFRVIRNNFSFSFHFSMTFWKLTEKHQMGRHVLWRLIWGFSVCLHICPINRAQCLYGLTLICLYEVLILIKWERRYLYGGFSSFYWDIFREISASGRFRSHIYFASPSASYLSLLCKHMFHNRR